MYLTIITEMFPFLKSTKFWVILIVTILLIGSVVFLYNRYTGMIEEISNLKNQNSDLENQVKERDDQIARYEIDIKTYTTIIKSTNAQRDMLDVESKKLENKLIKDGRDIGFIALKKPELMEKIVNKAAKDRLRCFEIATGAEVKPDEKNLKKSDRNNVCAYLFDYTD